MAESPKAIVTAAGANLAIAVAKFAGAALTGSSAMLSEGAHSLVDTTNQGLLLLGLHRAKKKPTERHPFGFGREVYFYSFVVAVLIFLAGGLYSLWEGYEKVVHPHAESEVTILGLHIAGVWVNLVILVLAVGAEGYSLVVAVKQLPKSSASPFSAIRRSKDPSLFVVIAEDTAAVAGLVLAAIGVLLAHILDMPVLDGVSSLGIGIVLIGMAGFLMFETHGLLIGESADPDIVEAIREAVRDEPAIAHVNEILTQHLGPRDVLVNASLDVDDSISGGEVEAVVDRLAATIKKKQPAIRRVFIEIQSRERSEAMAKARLS